MLHVRMLTPADRTEEVVALVEGVTGTTHLAVLAGAARDPRGDVVLCDVAREAADELLEVLRTAGVPEWGAVTVDDVGLTLSRRADAAEEAAPGEGADAIVWESLVEETHEESTLTFTFLAFLTLATMLAACGVIIDSAILIVGAMAVGPEFGPLAGLCTAIVRRAPRLARQSLAALLVGFPVAMAVTGGFSLLMDWLGLFHEARFLAARPQTAFIWQPDAFSFIVAFLAGAAGVLSLTSAKSGALIGVAISVTTVPAAANAAVALSYGNWTETRGSAVQLGLNLLGIVAAGTLTLLGQRWFWSRRRSSPSGV
ncbi:DUF389 domain-containing protein [Streptomyces huiliensis]|uniref:DUF389 domain-containing protein n=1 Tax=Streptomyces huiliensis TaxID=2876027 RepID=UPI001CBFC8E5|nr:DUF389 domain-containing protein [Streptomyces huiliensis]MBZ4321767.1 DUF389 domain-containing protein [Streptomyces huiliensis]